MKIRQTTHDAIVAQRQARERKNREEALNAAMIANSEIDDCLEILRRHHADHFGIDPETIDWAQTGDLQSIASDLRAICDRIQKTGEYAPTDEAK